MWEGGGTLFIAELRMGVLGAKIFVVLGGAVWIMLYKEAPKGEGV